jgi:hypothetical protein
MIRYISNGLKGAGGIPKITTRNVPERYVKGAGGV